LEVAALLVQLVRQEEMATTPYLAPLPQLVAVVVGLT
jgi:hypothetical protein